MNDRGIISYEEFYGRYLVQGMRDKVNEYIIEQQRLAEANSILADKIRFYGIEDYCPLFIFE
jgi:hypothetical protein